MCTPSAEELVTLREFLACKDPQDSTKTHTFSYLIDEEDHRVAEEILETSVSSPWEMIRSLTQEDSAGEDPAQRRTVQCIQGNGWQLTRPTEITPSAIFVPKVLGGGSDKATTASSSGRVPVLTRPGILAKPFIQLPAESSSRGSGMDSDGIRRLTSMAKSQIEATANPTSTSRQIIIGNARQQPSVQQHLIVERKVPRSRKGGPSVASFADRSSTKFPILGDTPSYGAGQRDGASSVSSPSQVGIKLFKVFENDEYITFKKVYPASMGGTPLASVGVYHNNSTSSQPSLDAESRGQSESRRSTHQREARMDPPERFEEEGRTDVISEETKVSSSGARQVLIVVSSKKQGPR